MSIINFWNEYSIIMGEHSLGLTKYLNLNEVPVLETALFFYEEFAIDKRIINTFIRKYFYASWHLPTTLFVVF